MNGNLVAVIVTYNRLDKLKQTIERSRHCSFYRTVVVNNCSSDGTAEWLDSLQDDNLVVIHSVVNGGGAGGFNLGPGGNIGAILAGSVSSGVTVAGDEQRDFGETLQI